MTPEDHAAVLQHLRNPRSKSVRRIVVALENTGARPGELTNARVRHFFPDIGALIHFADENRRPGDFRHKLAGKGKDRVIYFTGEGLDLVKELCAGKNPDDLLFPTSRGTKYTRHVLDFRFRRIAERAGLSCDFVPYSYRHTLATRWLMAGKPVETVAELLGDTVATVLKYYSHLCKAHSTLRARLEEFREETDKKK